MSRRYSAFSAVIWRNIALALGSVALMAATSAPSLLTIMQIEQPRSLDPADQTATFTGVVLDPVYEGLVRLDADNRIEPALALTWATSKDGLAWTFRLRHDVRFHDGTAFDARAVTYSFARMLSATRGLAGSGRFRDAISDVVADTPDQVTFHLIRPYAFLLQLLATSQAAIVSPVAEKAGGLGLHPVGTGPYRFLSMRSGDYVLEEKFSGYWGEKPSFDRLKWTWSTEMSVLNMAVRTNDADVVNPIAPVFARSIGQDKALQLIRSPGSAFYWVALNTRLPPLDDLRIRQALNYATDRRAMVHALLMDLGTPTASPLPPIMPDHDFSPDQYPYDVAKARLLLRKAGFHDDLRLSLAVQEPEEPIAEILQFMWGKAGIDLRIRRLESGVWAQAAFSSPQAKQHDGLDAVIASWSAGLIPDLELRPLYSTVSAAPAGANLGFFSNVPLDRILDQAAADPDPANRRQLYDRAQDIIQQQAAGIPLYVRDDLVAARCTIRGLQVRPGGELIVVHASRAETCP